MVGQVRAYGPWDTRQQRSVRFVYSEDDIRRALTFFKQATTTVDGQLFSGGAIVVAAPITVSRPIVIPTQCGGLTISSPARYAITPSGVVDTLFEVNGVHITIRDLYVRSRSTSKMFTAFITTGDDTANYLRVLDNVVYADRLYVENATFNPNYCHIRGNTLTGISASFSAPVLIYGQRTSIIDNRLLTDGGGDAITLSTGARFCAVTYNILRGADITTSASDGQNTVKGNTHRGTITLHANDRPATPNDHNT